MDKVQIGVIGGSGLYEIEGMTDVKEVKVSTPFGDPSDAIIVGTLSGKRVAFLPRHGRGHRIMPTEVNSRANIYALKSLGVEKIIAFSAVGSMKEEIKPRDMVIPDQLFDRTKTRVPTFYGNGIVAHIQFADPYCDDMRKVLYESGKKLSIPMHYGGTYICIEGPQFSTRAESRIYRSWGVDVIGMTNLPESKLAREAEICFATVALATDYDVWHEEDVSVETVVANVNANVQNSKNLIKETLLHLDAGDRKCKCATSLKGSIMTDLKLIPAETRKKVELLIGKYL